jgi:tRNA pseudouridine55 synthase
MLTGDFAEEGSMEGLLVLDKPSGITSRDAVDRAVRWFPRRTKVGHTGTLDPLATGVLVLCLGSATRLAEYVQAMTKTYRSAFRLGATSDSDDADGAVTPVAGARAPSLADVEEALRGLTGTIEQVPPAYSAAKVTGRRAYALARKGEEVQLTPRPVRVYAIDVLRYDHPRLEVQVRCGKGTYIRSLARDLGQRLGCGAYVEELRRTRVGPFAAEQAVPLDASAELARSRLLPAALALEELPRIELAPGERQALRQGRAVPLPPGQGAAGEAAVFDADGRAVAIVAVEAGVVRPVKVLG